MITLASTPPWFRRWFWRGAAAAIAVWCVVALVRSATYGRIAEQRLCWAAGRGDLHAVAALLRRVSPDGTGLSPLGTSVPRALHRAVMAGHSDVVGALLSAGADPNVNVCGWGTPLHCAARSDGAEAARLLLDAGADPNPSEPDSNLTPLHLSAANDSVACARLLVAAGADVERRAGPEGPSPLHSAAQSNAVDVTELLLSRGAQVNKLAKMPREPAAAAWSWQTPLDAAMTSGSTEVEALLLRRGAKRAKEIGVAVD